jgi:hypothetical protein
MIYFNYEIENKIRPSYIYNAYKSGFILQFIICIWL